MFTLIHGSFPNQTHGRIGRLVLGRAMSAVSRLSRPDLPVGRRPQFLRAPQFLGLDAKQCGPSEYPKPYLPDSCLCDVSMWCGVPCVRRANETTKLGRVESLRVRSCTFSDRLDVPLPSSVLIFIEYAIFLGAMELDSTSLKNDSFKPFQGALRSQGQAV